MYVYESHLGGLYSSEEEYDFDTLYCEECGDSDLLIGEFDKNDPDAFWNCMIENEGCIYSESTISNFIADNFNVQHPAYVYLIIWLKGKNKVVVNYFVSGRKFGEVHSVPHNFCYRLRIMDDVASDIYNSIVYWDVMDGDVELKDVVTSDGATYLICETEVEFDGDTDATLFRDVGWISPDDIKAAPKEEVVVEYIRGRQHEKK